MIKGGFFQRITRSPDFYPITKVGIKISGGNLSVLKSLHTRPSDSWGINAGNLRDSRAVLGATTRRLSTSHREDPQARQLLDRAIQGLGGQAFLRPSP